MIPLTVATPGEEKMVLRVSGREKTAHHLANLGIVPGSYVTVISELNGDLIIKVKDARIGISKKLALKVMV